MLGERARRHYQERGYTLHIPEVVAQNLRADFVAEKDGRRRAVRLDDDPLGTYQIGALAAEAKRAGVQATVICPGTPDVIAACEQFGVEHLSPEGLGDATPILAPGRRPLVVPEAPVESEPHRVPASAPAAAAAQERPAIPAWRWVIVGVIWLAAIVAWTILLTRIL